jgi:hypothetical protein
MPMIQFIINHFKSRNNQGWFKSPYMQEKKKAKNLSGNLIEVALPWGRADF